MLSTEVNYGEEYKELQEVRIPAMRKALKEYDQLLENAMGYHLTQPVPNIEIQYNNSSIYIDWEFRHAGIDPNNNWVREAIRSDMMDKVNCGIYCLTESADLIKEKRSESEILGKVDQYYDFDRQLWRYDYKKDIVDHVMLYCLATYNAVKAQEEKQLVDDILTPDILEEILETLKKLGFSEQVLLDAEEKWHEVLLDVLRVKEKEKEKAHDIEDNR